MSFPSALEELDSTPGSAATISLRNRQRLRRINTPLLRKILRDALCQLHVSDFELAIHFVAPTEMAHVNWTFLKHEGSTDVITFDYSEENDFRIPPQPTSVQEKPRSRVHRRQPPFRLCGEIFICVSDALKQAREFRTSWESELVRYAIHGLLHLCGHDDLKPTLRRRMKREENRLLAAVERKFDLRSLARRKK